jgi:D-alanine-D-alanine ligase
MRVAVLANLKNDVPIDEEHPPDDDYWDDLDDPKTVRAIMRSLRKHGHQAKYFAANISMVRRLLNYRPDLCFNICEGYFGESREAQIPALLDMLRLPYTGAGVLGMSLAHNKYMAKKIFGWVGLPTADYYLVTDPTQVPTNHLVYPLFVKPAHEGTSIGINKDARVSTYENLVKQVGWVWKKLKSPVLVEQYVDGREFTISILGKEILPIIEIVSPTGFYSNEQKEDDNFEVYRVCPADIPEEKADELRRIAMAAMQALELHDFCRLDLRMDNNGNIYILEVNPLPLLYPDPKQASFVYSANAAGYSYDQMINRIVEVTAERLGIRVPVNN